MTADLSSGLATVKAYLAELQETAKKANDLTDLLTTYHATLIELEKRASISPHYNISVLGEKRIGKSTLINALIGHDLLSRSEGATSVTGSMIEVHSTAENTFQGYIEWFSAKDFAAKVSSLTNMPEKGSERKRGIEMLQLTFPTDWEQKWSHICTLDVAAERTKYLEINIAQSPNANIISEPLRITASSLEELHTKLDPYMRSKLPLLRAFQKRTVITVPIQGLPPNIVLVDLPGSGDLDRIKAGVLQDYVDDQAGEIYI